MFVHSHITIERIAFFRPGGGADARADKSRRRPSRLREKTAWLLMLDAAYQGRGICSRILEGVLQSLKPSFSFVRLGYAKGNPQSERFWHKNGFSPTGSITKAEAYDIIVMQRKL